MRLPSRGRNILKRTGKIAAKATVDATQPGPPAIKYGFSNDDERAKFEPPDGPMLTVIAVVILIAAVPWLLWRNS